MDLCPSHYQHSTILLYQKAKGSCSYVCKFSSWTMDKIIHRHTLITLKYTKLKLTEYLKYYALNVSQAKGNKQQNMKIWLADNHTLMDLLKKTSNPSLFDQDKKNFYFSQQSLTRKTALSKETMKNMKNKLHCIALCTRHCVARSSW